MQRTIIHVLPSFHYDIAFRKTFRQYLPQALAAVQAGVALLKKNPDFTFNIEQVALFREYWRRHPAQHTLLRRFASAGRLIFAPGMLTMPDSNIPSGESFIRNALLGRRWLEKNLGVTPDCCWMADIFGHNPQSPQLARTCGYTSYMFERGKSGTWDTTFLWRGIDGTTIPAQWEIDTYYGINLPLWRKRSPAWTEQYLQHCILDPLKKHSADPTTLLTVCGGDFMTLDETHVNFIRKWKDTTGARMAFSTPARYFAALKRKKISLPILKDDLNPLLEGCWSTRIKLKQYNRILEEMAAELEMLECLTNRPPQASSVLWEAIVWNAFHDIICGSIVNRAAREAMALYKKADYQAKRCQRKLFAQLTRTTCNLRNGRNKAWLAFNSLPYPRREIVAIPRRQDFSVVDLPAAGFAVMHSGTLSSEGTAPVKILENGWGMENEFVCIRFGRNGTITSLYDKENKTELALPENGMNNPLRQPDAGDPWVIGAAHNSSLLRTAPFYDPLPLSSALEIDRVNRVKNIATDANASFAFTAPTIIHAHPLQATVEIAYPELCWTSQVTLRAGEKLVRFRTTFIAYGKEYRLRVAFPTAVRNGRIRHAVPCGHIERPEGQYACQGWIDYADQKKGLLLINRGLPGNNVMQNIMLLSLYRAPNFKVLEKNPDCEDGATHVFEYAVMPFHPGDPNYQPARLAAVFNRPPLIQSASHFAQIPPKWSSGFEFRGHIAELSCVERRGHTLILRLWEAAGQPGTLSIKLPWPIANWQRTTATGQPLAPKARPATKQIIRLKLSKFEIVTLQIRLK